MPSDAALEPRIPLVALPTPFEPLHRLGAELGMDPGRLWVKRDDVGSLAGGGNKARKLEHLCADATARGCDTLVTGGGLQSNHVRMTAAAANRLGLGCVVVLGGSPPERATGNLLLVRLLGPEIVWTGRSGPAMDYQAVERAILATADRLGAASRRPYPIPIGGASPVGALGYVGAAAEVRDQCLAAAGRPPDLVVVADGSGGTHAGLSVGLGDHGLVLGIDVGARPDVATAVAAKAVEVAALAGLPEPVGTVVVDHGHFGRFYGDLTDGARRAVRLAARTEGLLLDPVYTGKAMAGLIAARGDGRIRPDTTTVFVHTGGTPTLFAAGTAEWLLDGAAEPPRPGADRPH